MPMKSPEKTAPTAAVNGAGTAKENTAVLMETSPSKVQKNGPVDLGVIEADEQPERNATPTDQHTTTDEISPDKSPMKKAPNVEEAKVDKTPEKAADDAEMEDGEGKSDEAAVKKTPKPTKKSTAKATPKEKVAKPPREPKPAPATKTAFEQVDGEEDNGKTREFSLPLNSMRSISSPLPTSARRGRQASTGQRAALRGRRAIIVGQGEEAVGRGGSRRRHALRRHRLL